ncbi:heavy-metal-associated domain-containing protein [Micromonospora sp. MS34]|uniref:heavy-metal-associated domain-containing protein n=1 Tax=Micromonospora sp. MS34 TaxID=3385971 RepID=UPI0039A3D3F9
MHAVTTSSATSRTKMGGNESSHGCGTVTIDSAPAAGDTSTDARSTYQASGMTCGGCATKVAGRVSEIAGVIDVQAEVAAGTITVHGEEPLDTAEVRAAVQRAGYRRADGPNGVPHPHRTVWCPGDAALPYVPATRRPR